MGNKVQCWEEPNPAPSHTLGLPWGGLWAAGNKVMPGWGLKSPFKSSISCRCVTKAAGWTEEASIFLHV